MWGKEVIEGLSDNSCKCRSMRLLVAGKRGYLSSIRPTLSFIVYFVSLDVNQFGEEGYGAKANKVLSTVRGKDFRHEKTKRKRGTYTGGNITLASNSFKYDD